MVFFKSSILPYNFVQDTTLCNLCHHSDLRTFRKVRIVLRREVKHKKAAVVGETEILVKNLVIGTEHEHW